VARHGICELTARHGMAWERHAMCESAFRMFQNRPQDDVCTHYTILTGNGLTLGPKMVEVTAACKKKCLTRGSTTCTAEYCEGDQIREDHMARRAKCIQRFGGES